MNLRIYIFPSFWEPELRSVTRVSCHQGQHLCHTCAIAPNLCHNANNLPLWTWWQPQSHSPPLSSREKGYAPPEYMLKSLLCCVFHAPLTVGKVYKKMFYKKNHDFIHHTWPSHHQRPIHTTSSQPSGDIPILTHPPNQVGIHQIPIVYTWLKYYIIFPMHSGGINYIIWPKGLIKRLWQRETYYYNMGL